MDPGVTAMDRLAGIREFLVKWFKGPLGVGEAREAFYSVGDPGQAKRKERQVVLVSGFELLLDQVVLPSFRRVNLFIGVGALRPEYSLAAVTGEIDLAPEHLVYDTVQYDLDCETDPQLARDRALEFAASLRERYGVNPIVYVTGCKGARVVIPLKKPTDYEGYVLLARSLIQPYRYTQMRCNGKPLVDPSMFTDAKHLSRPPFTYNIKSGCKGFAKPIMPRFRAEEFDWSNFNPLDPSDVKVYKIKVDLAEPRPLRFKPRTRLGPKQPLPSTIEELASSEAVPPCIRNIVEAMVRSGDADHYARLALVWYLKWVGFDKEQVIEFFAKHARDYNERVTRYQVEYAYGLRGSRRDWLMPSCKWMQQHNLCLGCGWNRNPATYTYTRAQVPEEIRERFFMLAKHRRMVEGVARS